jgi:glyoxylase-like metal-dependent hydrolase (beta-lactamase superfamily II)
MRSVFEHNGAIGMRERFILLLTGLAALVFCPLPLQAADRFADVMASTLPLAEGVFVLTGAGGNIGVSVGADGTLIIDDQYAPMAGRIEAALTALGGERPRLVLNTHQHQDHVGGNAEFGRSGVIIAHDNVRARLLAVQGLPASALPLVTYTDTVTIHFNGEELALIHLPEGHTDGDTMVWFKNANVLHMGDQLFNGAFPYIDLNSGGTLDGYVANLRRVVSDMPGDITVIPGHGPVADIPAVARCLQVIEDTRQLVIRALAAGKDEGEIAEDLASYAAWGQGFISIERWIAIIKRDQAQRGSL